MKKKLWIVVLLICAISVSVGLAAERPAVPEGIRVPELAYDSSSIWLFWNRPKETDTAAYYNIYEDGKYLGNTRNDSVGIGVDKLRKFTQKNAQLVGNRIIVHSYHVTGLEADTEYHFTVRAVSTEGMESSDSPMVSSKTTVNPEITEVKEYGAAGDGMTLDTAALQRAIDACPYDGIVKITNGTYRTGALFLKSHMTLQLDAGAMLRASDESEDFAPVQNGRYQGILNVPDGGENIRIVGQGVIDGNGWMQDTDGIYLKANNKTTDGYDTRHVFNIGILAKQQVKALMDEEMSFKQAYAGRSTMVIFHDVHNVYFEGVTFENPSNHVMAVQGCNNVTLNNISIKSYDCNNGDGIDFSGNNFTVANSYIDTGDDGIDFNAGIGKGAENKPPVSGSWIFNNYFAHGHGAVVLGSHTGSWIEDVVAEDNVMEGTDIGLRCKTGQGVGGGARNVIFRNNILKSMKRQAFIFTTAYTDANAVGEFEATVPGQFHDITVENCNVDGTGAPAIEVDGLEEMPHKNLTFKNIGLYNAQANKLEHLENGIFENVVFF